jgi:purine-binding chemotaxis protein CheW
MLTIGTVNNLLAFEIDGYQFGLHLSEIQRVVQAVDIQPLPDVPDTVAGLINVQGNIVPVINTRRRLGLPERALELTDLFIIALAEKRSIALIVDSVQGVVEYTDDQLVELDETTDKATTGVLRIVDGLLLVYNPDKSLSMKEWSNLAVALQHPGQME